MSEVPLQTELHIVVLLFRVDLRDTLGLDRAFCCLGVRHHCLFRGPQKCEAVPRRARI